MNVPIWFGFWQFVGCMYALMGCIVLIGVILQRKEDEALKAYISNKHCSGCVYISKVFTDCHPATCPMSGPLTEMDIYGDKPGTEVSSQPLDNKPVPF